MSFFNKQINEYDQFKENLIMRMQHQTFGHGGIVDSQTRRIVHFSNYINVLRVLREHSLSLVMNITKDYQSRINYMIDPWNYVLSADGLLVFDPNHDLSSNDLQRFILLREKSFAYEYISSRMEFFHLSAFRGELKHQSEIYETKARQAKLVLLYEKTNYEDTFFVHDWAELRGIDLQTAAKEIQFKNDNAKIFLASIEYMRLKYTILIFDEQNIDNIANIIQQFDTDTYVNAAV